MTKHTIYIELDLEEGSGRIAEGSQALLAELVKVNPKGVEQALLGVGERILHAALYHACSAAHTDEVSAQ